MKKRTMASVLSLLLCVGLLAGCAPSNGKLSGTVATDGSTSMEKVIGSLGEAFEAETGVAVAQNPTGSSAGITAVAEKRCDIGLSSRDLKEEEKKTLTGTVVALDGIAVVVNNANTVADLSVEQLGKIFMGEITNWKDVGGTEGEIVLIGREAGSGTRDGFESITDTKDKCAYRNELPSTGAVLEGVKSNPNAVGYASLSAVSADVKALTVGGVAPSEAAVLDGTYAVQRDFLLVTRTGEALPAAAQAFFDYATSTAANDMITKAGAVPVAK